MVGQHGAKHQGAKLRAQPHCFKTEPAKNQSQQEPEQNQQLIVTTGIQQFEQQRSEQGQTKDDQRPLGGRLAGGQTHHHEGNQILHDQDSDGDTPMEGSQFTLGFQHLGGQHGTGKGECDGEQKCSLPREFHQQVEAGGKHRTGDAKVKQAAADDFRADDGT